MSTLRSVKTPLPENELSTVEDETSEKEITLETWAKTSNIAQRYNLIHSYLYFILIILHI